MSDLNAIEFDSPFTVFPGGNIINPIGVYAPSVEHSETTDIEIDGCAPNDSNWEPFSVRYTGQYGYTGAVMHASEQLSGALAADILATPGTYVICAVEAPCTEDEPCFPDEPNHCIEHGCDAFPAGWTVLKLKD